MLPKLNKKRALFVPTRIEEILAWEQRTDTERDTRFVETRETSMRSERRAVLATSKPSFLR
jgi:hypothetical protein